MTRVDRRLDIMRAAEKLSTSRRFHEITLDDVVREAKVGKGTIYLYFKNKDDLFFQVAVSGFDELCDLVRSKVRETIPFQEQLLSACTNITAFYRNRGQLFRMMQSEEARMRWCHGKTRENWNRRRRNLVQALGAIFDKGLAEGQVRRDAPPEVLAEFLLGMLRTRARNLEDAPESARSLELVLDLFLRGACAPTSGRGGLAALRGERAGLRTV